MSTQQAHSSTDPIALDELADRCLGQLDFIQRVLTSFAGRFEDDLAQLRKELCDGNTTNVATLAHRMKGACGNTAAHELCRQMAQIEELAREERLDEIPSCIDSLEEEWTRFLSWVESFATPDGINFAKR